MRGYTQRLFLLGDVGQNDKRVCGENESECNATSPHPRITNLSGTYHKGKRSMIVSVWVSHCDRAESETLVYDLLDTESDTTLILDDTCDAIGTDRSVVYMFLSTMSANNHILEKSRKIRGLMVRGGDSPFKIPLPVAFSRETMTANSSYKPTPWIVNQWPRLERIASKLMLLNECQVGLLIEHNFSCALIPRDVIPSSDDGPYVQKTDLGLIVGIVEPSQYDCTKRNHIGLSNMILVCEVIRCMYTYHISHVLNIP